MNSISAFSEGQVRYPSHVPCQKKVAYISVSVKIGTLIQDLSHLNDRLDSISSPQT
jgi:hypothetical protein